MKRTMLIFAVAFAVSLACLAQQKPSNPAPAPKAPKKKKAHPVEGGSGEVYGDAMTVHLKAPEGWLYDDTSGRWEKKPVIMYPVGNTYPSAYYSMYIKIYRLHVHESYEDFVSKYTKDFTDSYSFSGSSKGKPIKLSDGRWADVRYLVAVDFSNFQAVAFVQVGIDVVVYTLHTMDRDDWRRDFPAFKQMVGNSSIKTWMWPHQ